MYYHTQATRKIPRAMPLIAQDPRVGADIDQAAAEIVTGTSFPDDDDDDDDEGADVTRETPLEAVPELVPDRVVRPDCVALAEEPPDPAWLSLELAVVPAAVLPAVFVWSPSSPPPPLPPLEPESPVVVVPVELASCVLAGAGEVSPAVVVPASSLPPPPPLPDEPDPEPDEATVAEGKTVMKVDVAWTSWQSRS